MTHKTHITLFLATFALAAGAVASTDTGGFTDARDPEGAIGVKVGNGLDEREQDQGAAEGGTDAHGL